MIDYETIKHLPPLERMTVQIKDQLTPEYYEHNGKNVGEDPTSLESVNLTLQMLEATDKLMGGIPYGWPMSDDGGVRIEWTTHTPYTHVNLNVHCEGRRSYIYSDFCGGTIHGVEEVSAETLAKELEKQPRSKP